MSESAFSPEETLAPILLQDSYKIVFFQVYVTVINMLLMCWICTCFMELGVLALMFAPSYQLISCGSRDRGPNSLSLLPLLSGVVLILSPLSFYVILTQKFTFFIRDKSLMLQMILSTTWMQWLYIPHIAFLILTFNFTIRLELLLAFEFLFRTFFWNARWSAMFPIYFVVQFSFWFLSAKLSLRCQSLPQESRQ